MFNVSTGVHAGADYSFLGVPKERYGKQHNPSGPECAQALSQCSRIVRYVLQHIKGEYEIERRIGKRKPEQAFISQSALVDVPLGYRVSEVFTANGLSVGAADPLVQGCCLFRDVSGMSPVGREPGFPYID